MRLYRILVLCSAVVGTPSALAGHSFDAGALGRMEGVLAVCAKVTPREASTYLLKIKALIGAAPKDSVSEAHKTEEYRQAYQSVSDELSNLTQDGVTEACAGYLTTTN
jgi:hypothetical protein